MIAPTALQLKATGQSELTMTWKRPDYPVGIQHYYAYIIEDSSKYCSTDRSGESCTIGGLSSYHKYNVCVVSCGSRPNWKASTISQVINEDICSKQSCLSNFTLPEGEFRHTVTSKSLHIMRISSYFKSRLS